jgi:DNA-binding phage protein
LKLYTIGSSLNNKLTVKTVHQKVVKEIKMKIKQVILVSMTVFALLIGSFMGITSLVSAQEANPVTDLISSENGGRGGGADLESVAEALGVSVEELKSALDSSRPAECVGLERGEKPEGVDCRPDFEAAATALGISAEELESAFETARETARAEHLAQTAEQLGVSVEELEAALENARPAECANLTREEAREAEINCRPDLEALASELGVTTEEIQSAIGRGGRGAGLENVAETLGVTTEELQTALQESKPEECANGEQPEGVNCRPNLEEAAETLGVDAEELETALQNERGGRGPRGGGEDKPEHNGEGGRP